MKPDEIGLSFAVRAGYEFVEFYPDTGRIVGWGHTKELLSIHQSNPETKIKSVEEYSKLTE